MVCSSARLTCNFSNIAFPTDVTEIPTNGIWFQLIANGATKINNGTDGLACLDKVVEVAQEHGIYLILLPTNNWNPLPGDDTTQVPAVFHRDSTTGNELARNYLSNDFGRMDTYVHKFGQIKTHNGFYTNSSIVNFSIHISPMLSQDM